MNEITTYDNVPVIADDSLIAIAKQAEARIDAVIKIKQLALKVTNPTDWTSQQDKPYLLASGSEKIANLFNISWGFLTPEPLYEEDEEGHYTYTFQGRFTMGGRTIEVEGSRSSRDKFFMQYDYSEGKDRVEKSIKDRDNKRDVKMAALTNLLGNGITRILGIRNLTWEDLLAFANIKKEEVSSVRYKTGSKDKQPLKEPESKSEGARENNHIYPATEKQKKMIWARMGKVTEDKTEWKKMAIQATNKEHSSDWIYEDINKLIKFLDNKEIPSGPEEDLIPPELQPSPEDNPEELT